MRLMQVSIMVEGQATELLNTNLDEHFDPTSAPAQLIWLREGRKGWCLAML